ncbi:MAG: diphthine--ammonia ligase [Phycisphaerae bacterium]|nr:diphthine--ammonia ligase [Phycisphaerae bacterium]
MSRAEGKILLAWSSGKDSAMALHELQQSSGCEIVGLLTTITEGYQRVSIHGVREELLDSQGASIGLPLTKVWIPQESSLDEYERRMGAALDPFVSQGVSGVAFGDIFLEDLRKDREDKLARAGLAGFFPIWKRDTTELAQRFISAGFKAIVTCVDTEFLDASFAGRAFDEQFLADLPAGVDPCGENGEFHSFTCDGPIFSRPIACRKGEVVLRDNRFCFCDLIATA